MKFGRLPRKFDNRIMSLRDLSHKVTLPQPPPKVDWTKGITDFGMMLNDQLGDCTCAALYHARQIWSLNNGGEDTQPDSMVQSLYEKACGYNPDDSSTDQGGNEQDLLHYCMKTGMPLADGSVDKLIGFIEASPQLPDEVKLTVADFGVSYLGITVPSNIMNEFDEPVDVWDYDPNATSLGGHAVIIVGYDETGFTIVSWGQLYKMTYAFLQNNCEESYALVSSDWLKQGKTPLGMTLPQLESMMTSFR